MIQDVRGQIEFIVKKCTEALQIHFVQSCGHVAIEVFAEWLIRYAHHQHTDMLGVMSSAFENPNPARYDLLYRQLLAIIPDSEAGSGSHMALNAAQAVLSAVKFTMHPTETHHAVEASIALLTALDFADMPDSNAHESNLWWSLQTQRLKNPQTRIGKEFLRQQRYCEIT